MFNNTQIVYFEFEKLVALSFKKILSFLTLRNKRISKLEKRLLVGVLMPLLFGAQVSYEENVNG
jgi:hypothetical protein